MEKKVKSSDEPTVHFTQKEIGILYQLSQSATISVKDMQAVAEVLNKCLDYINKK